MKAWWDNLSSGTRKVFLIGFWGTIIALIVTGQFLPFVEMVRGWFG